MSRGQFLFRYPKNNLKMAEEHTFHGTWEIVSCSFEGKQEISGLEGIKFRLDEIGDITWYNDLVNPLTEKDCDNCYGSVNELFSFETFDVNHENPRLVFGAFNGHSIEFKTQTLTPADSLMLECENWYTFLCKRLIEGHAVGQQKEFTFTNALKEGYFSDVVIISLDGVSYNFHSTILRLNGFDCSMCSQPKGLNGNLEDSKTNPIQISITIPNSNEFINNIKHDIQNITPPGVGFLCPPNLISIKNSAMGNLSSSFNCLTAKECMIIQEEPIKKCPTSVSDTNIQSNSTKNIFNFSNDIYISPTDIICCSRKPPLSPYRARSPSPFPSCLDTPPTSPLTPVNVLNNLYSSLLVPIIHWLYSESLPPNLNEEICEQIISFAEQQPPLNKLVNPCKKYLNLIKLRKFVVEITMETHDVLNQIIVIINPNTIATQPKYLCNTFIEGFRLLAVGFAKILQFWNIFIKQGPNLSRYQKNEIIKYVWTRFPIFMSQLHQLVINTLAIFAGLTMDEKLGLATYLVPEIELSLMILTNVMEEIKCSLEQMCKDFSSSNIDIQRHGRQMRYLDIAQEKHINLADSDIKYVLYVYQMRKMRDMYDKIANISNIFKEKRSAFTEMNVSDKRSTVLQNLEQLILLLPNFIAFLETISDKCDDKVGWKEFKFCFKLAASHINGVITKVLSHRTAFNSIINKISNLVQRDEFTKSIMELGFVVQTGNEQTENQQQFQNKEGLNFDYKNLNLTRNLCEPPLVVDSYLSKNALRILHSGHLADMEFEVHVFPNIDDLYSKDYEYNNLPTQVHTFRAHRVIVSARCDWFKKALLSGMQESIHRKIVIKDTSPVIFRRLLLYLYGAPIDRTVGAEQICELMLLADRYSIDDLKELCETTLNSLIDEDSVLCLLGIADRYMTSVLKSNCLSFISQHPNLTKLDMFKQLPRAIQLEVRDLINWYGRISEPWGDEMKSRSNSRHSLKSPSKSRSRSRKSSPSLI